MLHRVTIDATITLIIDADSEDSAAQEGEFFIEGLMDTGALGIEDYTYGVSTEELE